MMKIYRAWFVTSQDGDAVSASQVFFTTKKEAQEWVDAQPAKPCGVDEFTADKLLSEKARLCQVANAASTWVCPVELKT